ncbi:hypothetical protein F5Y13DRAFT_156975 [Hypoxylon sp. FL1857]|nr:hypothetical protein F5Y13DRAFT_156975 [Hypoxylon sp. FL1857]
MHQLQRNISAWREESQEKTSRFEEEQASNQYQSIMSWLKADESDQLAIFDSISVEGSKYPGTCDWALKNKKIVSFFKNKPETPILWLQGGPGSGKSVLSTQLVNFMRAAKMFVIHHFCMHSYASSTTYEQTLRSLLLQILRKDCDLVAHVYEECVLGKKAPTISTLERLLHTLLISISQGPRQNERCIWIVIDGLNECSTQVQASVATLMNQITSTTSSSIRVTCKVLISSRASSTISSRLRRKQVLFLTEEKENIGLAIRQYASQRLVSLQEKFNQLHLSSSEVEDVRDGITKKFDGMFLYARLVLDFLDNKIFYRSCEVKESVNELPEKLSDFYRKILIQILAPLDTQSVIRVKSIFCWIAFARRPLKKIEFLSAISFSAGDPDVAHLAPTYILDICGSLVEERQDSTLAFIHVSVKEFLQSSPSGLPSSGFSIDEREAVAEHSVATITCLLSGLDVFTKTCQNDTKYLRVARGLHGFHVYSTEYWIEYLLSHATSTPSDNTPVIFDLAIQLAERLHVLRDHARGIHDSAEPVLQDERLVSLRHPLLRKEVEWTLCARSLKGLESGLQTNGFADKLGPSTNLPSEDGISIMLASYEESVKFLLAQNDYPGVSAEELETFKCQFRASAYTCRLTSCPRATLGFQSEALRLDHEMTHLPRVRCSFPGCQNPPFTSAQALKNHVKKHHGSQPARKSIRQVSTNLAGSPCKDQDANNSQSTAIKEYDERLGSIPPNSSTSASPEGTFNYKTDWEAFTKLHGRLEAPRPVVGREPTIASPPAWLLDLVDALKKDGVIDNRFEGTMHYNAVDTNTGKICAIPDPSQPLPSHIRFYFLPGIYCIDCLAVINVDDRSNLDAHLESERHRSNVEHLKMIREAQRTRLSRLSR